MYPFFHQRWALFVPTPKQNFNIYVKYDKTNNQWKDVFYQLNSAHQKNRLSGNESLLLGFSNALRYYASSVEEKNEFINLNNDNINFLILKKIVINYLNQVEKTDIKQLQILLGITEAGSNKQHFHYYKSE